MKLLMLMAGLLVFFGKLGALEEKFSSEQVECIFHPIIKTSIQGSFELRAELMAVSPTLYKITLKGFEEDEKLQFCSISYNESHSEELIFTKDFSILLSPGVIGEEGGAAAVLIEKANGDRLSFLLPWGMELKKHFSEN